MLYQAGLYEWKEDEVTLFKEKTIRFQDTLVYMRTTFRENRKKMRLSKTGRILKK